MSEPSCNELTVAQLFSILILPYCIWMGSCHWRREHSSLDTFHIQVALLSMDEWLCPHPHLD